MASREGVHPEDFHPKDEAGGGQARLDRLTAMLRTVRGIGRLITRETDRDRLLSGACRLLAEPLGFHNVWIALLKAPASSAAEALNGGGTVGSIYHTGGGDLPSVTSLLRAGKLPVCARTSFGSRGVHWVQDPWSDCPDCLLMPGHAGRAGLSVSLEHEGQVFGWMTASVPQDRSADEEQKCFFAEVAADLAYALWSLETEARRESIERDYAVQLTEQKRAEAERDYLEQQLHQAQKMESVGRLAGGVAHDFNNMLAVIIGHAEMGLMELEPGHPVHESLREIQHSAERSAELTRQLLAFARKQTVSPRVLSLNRAVEGMLKILRRLIGENIELVFKPGEGLWPVKIDPGQIDQLLANLCVNSRDAIDGSGEIVIETGNVRIGEKNGAEHLAFLSGEYVELNVRDSGCGMDAETRAHLFEPFFTTKRPGEGTGLGLSTVYGIVKQNEGVIDFDSKPGHGTSFRIYLPRHEGKTEQLGASTSSSDVRGHETVLLVEDERAILALGKRMLERLGYQVLAAGTPGEAIELAEKHPEDIHLLLTDVIMPEMNGHDLSAKLQSLFPDMKRIFVSGYTADVIAHQGVLEKGVHFLQKPFSMKKLAGELRRVLG